MLLPLPSPSPSPSMLPLRHLALRAPRAATLLALLALIAHAAMPSLAHASAAKARAHLQAGELDEAAREARRAIADHPDEPDAWVVLGLTHYRSERFAEALQAFDKAVALSATRTLAASAQPVSPAADSTRSLPSIHFNRGSCLFQLDRFQRAEEAFAQAAAGDGQAGDGLRPLALLNAGFAALEQGALERATSYGDKAAAHGDQVPELAELLEELRADISAEQRARAAATADATVPARPPIAPQNAATTPAARRRPLRGLAALGTGLGAHLEVSGGYDSNVTQSGIVGQAGVATTADTAGSAFGSVSGEIGLAGRAGHWGFWRTAYSLDQLAYVDADVDQYNLQQHLLTLRAEATLAAWLRVGARLQVGALLSGLESFEGLLWDIGGALYTEADAGRRVTVRLGSRVARATALADEASYLTSTRWDLRGSVRLRLGRLNSKLQVGYRFDRLGTQISAVSVTQTAGIARVGECDNAVCNGMYVIPLAYTGPSALLDLSITLWGDLELAVDAWLQWRRYDNSSVLQIDLLTGQRDVVGRKREDLRLVGGATLGYLFFERYEIATRYEVARNFSNIDNTRTDDRHQLDFDNLNYMIHTVQLSLSVDL